MTGLPNLLPLVGKGQAQLVQLRWPRVAFLQHHPRNRHHLFQLVTYLRMCRIWQKESHR